MLSGRVCAAAEETLGENTADGSTQLWAGHDPDNCSSQEGKVSTVSLLCSLCLSVINSHKHTLIWTNMYPLTQHLPLPEKWHWIWPHTPAHLLLTHPWCLKGLFTRKWHHQSGPYNSCAIFQVGNSIYKISVIIISRCLKLTINWLIANLNLLNQKRGCY